MARAPRPLHVYSGGFLKPRIRRILDLAGWRVTTGWPGASGSVGVWGASPTAWRGMSIARRSGAALLRVEDAPLRSLFPGRMGEPPLGLMLDATGLHWDASRPSDLERHLQQAPLDDPGALAQARQIIARLQRLDLTKYAATRTDLEPPAPGYVLVVDQTRGDAALMGAGQAEFRHMLARARAEHPDAPVLIKTHPETARGLRPGHYSDADGALYDAPIAPYRLLKGARAVYTWSSQLGFEAILAGHRPHVFGTPFYAGWGLSHDPSRYPRRSRRLIVEQLCLGALMETPVWYDPHRDALCDLSRIIDILEARTRAWREDRAGYTAAGMRLWKRAPLRRFYGQHGPMRFAEGTRALRAAQHHQHPVMVWAGKERPEHAAPRLLRIEDGFLRSRGLGAELVPPMSLVADDLGIYYDPHRPSRLCALIATPLSDDERARAQALIARITREEVTKYNVGQNRLPPIPNGHRILVPGQVEDDASIRLGCTGPVRSNRDLLRAARKAHPDAVLIYKPHPDTEAGLRPGTVPDAADLADIVVSGTNAAALLGVVDQVWTMTSLMGFEALLRGVPVTCLGAPFYAGWGLTEDRAPIPAKRGEGGAPVAPPNPVDLLQLAHAALIAYPRYHDPVTAQPCAPEVILDRLANGQTGPGRPTLRLLSKVQGLMASHSWLWRR